MHTVNTKPVLLTTIYAHFRSWNSPVGERQKRERKRSQAQIHILVENSSMHNITLHFNTILELERVTAAALHLVFLQKRWHNGTLIARATALSLGFEFMPVAKKATGSTLCFTEELWLNTSVMAQQWQPEREQPNRVVQITTPEIAIEVQLLSHQILFNKIYWIPIRNSHLYWYMISV